MRSAARRLARHVLASAELAAARPDYAQGLRAASVTIFPLLLGELTGHPGLIWVALGGWLATFADSGGPYRARFAAMGTATLATALAFAAASWLGAHLALAVPALFACALYCGLLRVYGDEASTLGVLALLAFCIGLGIPQPALAEAALRGAFWAAGGALSMLVALSLWPVHPYKPARFAVAGSFAALAAFARAMQALGAESAQDRWHDLARSQRKAVREALEKARATLTSARNSRASETPRGEQLLVLYELAEQALGELAGLSEALQRRAERGEAPPAHEPLGRIAQAFEAVAAAVPADKPLAETPAVEVRFDDEAARLLRRNARTARLSLETAARLHEATTRGPRPGAPRRVLFDAPPPRRLRDALTLSSLDLRHALRLATAVTAAQAAGAALHLSRIHWVTVTVVLVLQPHSGATARKTLQRVGGTVIGAAAASLLAPLVHSPLWAAALLFPLSVGAIALRPINYGLFAALVTPVFVLMAEASSGDWTLASARLLNTLAGGAVSLAAAYLLWPAWEREQLPRHLAALLEAQRAYLKAVTAQPRDALAAAAARRRLGLASVNAEASFQRFLAEPHETRQLEGAMSLLAWSRRLSGSAHALWHALEDSARPADPARAAALDRALAELSGAAREARAPDARAAEAVAAVAAARAQPVPDASDAAIAGNYDALSRQLERLSAAVARLAR